MKKGKYSLAGHTFEVSSFYPLVHIMFEKYKSDDRTEFTVVVTEEKIEYERKHSKGGDHFPNQYLDALAVYRMICERMISYDTILFHSSALMLDGTAYLFTAHSGTGKSTHARLWREYFGDRVTMINDDKPLISFGKDGAVVWGTPYAGKECIHNNVSAKVGGIIFLHQHSENVIRPMSQKESFPLFLEQSYRPVCDGGRVKTMELLLRLSALPTYSLGCTISREAVELAYQTLTGNK